MKNSNFHFSLGVLIVIGICLLLSFTLRPTLYPNSLSSYGKGNIMCAPINKLNIDLECAVEPLAPRIAIDWQNQMDITATSGAKEFFNQGLFFLYGFNHAEAERSFKEGIRLDENCAMCYWGASLSLGPNINVPMPESQIKAAYDYSQKALQLRDNISDKEQALINALSYRYEASPPEDRTPLDAKYSKELSYVASRYREDIDIATLYAESLMDLMPWDYWEADNSPKPQTREVRSLLDYVLEKDPSHPGANHYYIHLTEAVHPQLAVPSADRLNDLDYPSGHLIHMPSHVYIRVGRFADAYDMNLRSIASDEEYIAACNVQGLYPAIYYPHNIHFLWFVAMMEGKSESAIASAKKLEPKVPFAMMAAVPMIELFKPLRF